MNKILAIFSIALIPLTFIGCNGCGNDFCEPVRQKKVKECRSKIRPISALGVNSSSIPNGATVPNVDFYLHNKLFRRDVPYLPPVCTEWYGCDGFGKLCIETKQVRTTTVIAGPQNAEISFGLQSLFLYRPITSSSGTTPNNSATFLNLSDDLAASHHALSSCNFGIRAVFLSLNLAASIKGQVDVYLVPAGSGTPTQLTLGGTTFAVPSWTQFTAGTTTLQAPQFIDSSLNVLGVTGLGINGLSNYVTVCAGSYNVVVTATGTSPTTGTKITTTPISFCSCKFYTLVIADANPTFNNNNYKVIPYIDNPCCIP